MESIGVRDLRQHASRWLARVQAGESFQITDRGRAVAILRPVAASGWQRLVAAGLVTPSVGDLFEVEPLERSGVDVSGALRADRDSER